MESDQVEKLLGKACYYFLQKIHPKGLAVFDEQTGEKFCIFYERETETLQIQKSETVAYDLVECDIAKETELN